MVYRAAVEQSHLNRTLWILQKVMSDSKVWPFTNTLCKKVQMTRSFRLFIYGCHCIYIYIYIAYIAYHPKQLPQLKTCFSWTLWGEEYRPLMSTGAQLRWCHVVLLQLETYVLRTCRGFQAWLFLFKPAIHQNRLQRASLRARTHTHTHMNVWCWAKTQTHSQKDYITHHIENTIIWKSVSRTFLVASKVPKVVWDHSIRGPVFPKRL